MTPWRVFGRQAFAALLTLSVIVWSVMPATGHALKLFDTIEDHLEMISDHGHTHGFEEDLYWAMHGHSHDAADHDHSQALVAFDDRTLPASAYRDAWRVRGSPDGSKRNFRIERPPRA